MIVDRPGPARSSTPRPQGVPYLSKDLDELGQHVQALKAALENDTLGRGREIENFEDATIGIIACCRWLARRTAR
ncbi:hypothetical protein [Actinokineospora inagensis]|uniref:hypothetical protein n=1 Tax=Actinokineospora inagensis TaxID=103730 RepID=UPI000418C61E|nr:hypothetical protein [Actinokineospora inagensis]